MPPFGPTDVLDQPLPTQPTWRPTSRLYLCPGLLDLWECMGLSSRTTVVPSGQVTHLGDGLPGPDILACTHSGGLEARSVSYFFGQYMTS
jgi:hypothetical protein